MQRLKPSNMKYLNLRQRPYELLGLSGLFLFFLSLVPSSQGIDINLHDTYFVIGITTFYSVFAAMFLFIWLIYLLVNRIMMSNTLTWIHVITCLLPIILFFIMQIQAKVVLNGIPRKYYSFNEFEKMKPAYNWVIGYVIGFALILIGQLIFLINLICGIIKYITKKRQIDLS